MASTGTYLSNFHTGYRLQLVWQVVSQNVSVNSSTVEVKVQLVSLGSSYTINSSAAKSGTLTINGTTYNFSFTASLTGSQTKTLVTKTVQIPHASDGTKSCAFAATVGLNVSLGGTQVTNVSVSGTGTFDTIPRASTPTLSAQSIEIGQSVTISTNRASSDFTHTLTYRFGTRTGSIATGVAATRTWQLPMALCDEIPNATSGKGTIYCETFLDGVSVGRKAVEFTATVPASVVPTIDSVGVSEAVSGLAEKFGAYVQGKSRLAVTVAAEGARGSTIASIKTYIQGVEYRGASITSDALLQAGSLSMTTVIADSRGRVAQVQTPYSVTEYAAPTISAFSGTRADSAGTPDTDGECLSLSLALEISPVGQANDKTHTIRYRRQGTEAWTTLQSGSAYSVDTTLTSGAVFLADYAWEVELVVSDYFGSVTARLDVPTAFTLFDFNASGKGIAFGKVSEKDAMEIALDVDLTGTLLQEDVTAPTLLNGWENYSSTGFYAPAGYWKDSCGVVHLTGMIKGGAIAAGTTLFTLPEGYRPGGQELFATVSVNLPARVDVAKNGNVYIQSGGNAGWLSLCGISFRAAE